MTITMMEMMIMIMIITAMKVTAGAMMIIIVIVAALSGIHWTFIPVSITFLTLPTERTLFWQADFLLPVKSSNYVSLWVIIIRLLLIAYPILFLYGTIAIT